MFDLNWWWAIPLAIADGVLAAAVTGEWSSALAVVGPFFFCLLAIRYSIWPDGVVRTKGWIGNWWLQITLAASHLLAIGVLTALWVTRADAPEKVDVALLTLKWVAASILVGCVAPIALLIYYGIKQERENPPQRAAAAWDALDEELFGPLPLAGQLHGNADKA